MYKRIAHICLNVKNLQRSIDFYCGKLGFSKVFEFTRKGKVFGIYLKIAENTFVEIFENKNTTLSGENSLAHFCLEVDSIHEMYISLQEKGIKCTDVKKGCDNTYQIWLEDPDGNKFELHQYSEISSQYTGQNCEADW